MVFKTTFSRLDKKTNVNLSKTFIKKASISGISFFTEQIKHLLFQVNPQCAEGLQDTFMPES